jgi:hypothetical protein
MAGRLFSSGQFRPGSRENADSVVLCAAARGHLPNVRQITAAKSSPCRMSDVDPEGCRCSASDFIAIFKILLNGSRSLGCSRRRFDRRTGSHNFACGEAITHRDADRQASIASACVTTSGRARKRQPARFCFNRHRTRAQTGGTVPEFHEMDFLVRTNVAPIAARAGLLHTASTLDA